MQHHVAQNAAAHRRGHAHHGHAEQIHPLADAQRRAGDGKGHRADQFKIQLKRLHITPPDLLTIHCTARFDKGVFAPPPQRGITAPACRCHLCAKKAGLKPCLFPWEILGFGREKERIEEK